MDGWYDLGVVGPSGLIAAPVRWAGRKGGRGRRCRRSRMTGPGSLHGLLQGASPSLAALRAKALSEATREEEAERPPFLLPIESWLDSGNTGAADYEAFCRARKRKA